MVRCGNYLNKKTFRWKKWKYVDLSIFCLSVTSLNDVEK